MKLTTVLIFGVCTLGSTYTLADHRHDDGHKHYRYARHHQAHSFFHKARHDNRIGGRHERVASRSYRDRSGDASYARVIDVEPVYRYYTQPVSEQSCTTYDHSRPNYRSHTATVLGAVIGGALGHRIGDAHGDPGAAAVAGGLLGASVGRSMDLRAGYNRGLRVEGPCRITDRRDRGYQQSRRELVEYKVTYRYNGKIHNARMDYDPGKWVKLDVSFTPA